MKICENILEMVGNTPLLKIPKINFETGAEVYLKMESNNPTFSVKDRLAKAMIEDAEARGVINKDSIIIEPSSGNTGIGLAMVCAVKSYK